MTDQTIVPAVLAEQYSYHMGQIAEAVPEILKRNVQLWRSVFEIYTKRLWKADARGFRSQEEWIDSLKEDFLIPRSTVMQRMSDAQSLIERAGASRGVAIDAATLIPSAARKVADSPQILPTGMEADEYLLELVALPPAEALARASKDAGTNVSMWCSATDSSGETLLAVVARSDEQGFQSFDVTIRVDGDPSLRRAVMSWIESRLKRR